MQWSDDIPALAALRPLPRRPLPPRRPRPLVRGRGAARPARGRARRSGRRSTAGSSTAISRSRLRQGRRARRRRSRKARSTGCSGAPTASCVAAPGRATRTATASVRNALAANYATAIKQDVFSGTRPSPRIDTRGGAPRSRTSRSTCSTTCSRRSSGTCRPGIGTGTSGRRCSASTRCSRTTSGRRSARIRPGSSTSSASSGSANRSRRSEASTSPPFAGAAWKSGGSTSTRTRARWAARSPRARRARTRSSS